MNPGGMVTVETDAVAFPFSNLPDPGMIVVLHDAGDMLHEATVTPPVPWTIVVNRPVDFWVWLMATETVVALPSLLQAIVPVTVATPVFGFTEMFGPIVNLNVP